MPGIDVDELLAKLRGIVATRRVRIAEFLRDSDPLRTGYVAPERLRAGLHAAGLDVSDAEYAALADRFSGAPRRPDAVRWQDFADALEAVFVTKGLERQPTLARSTSPVRTRGIGGPAPLSPVAVALPKPLPAVAEVTEIPESARRVLRRIVAWAAPRRADFLPFFEDFDRLRRGHVVPGKFAQGLEACGVRLLPADVQAVMQPFVVGTDSVDYRAFLKAFEEELKVYHGLNPTAGAGASAATATEAAALGSTGGVSPLMRTAGSQSSAKAEPVDLQQVLEHIRREVNRRGIRPHEFLADFDRLRTGRVHRSKFLTGLGMTGLKLQENEQEVLTSAYALADDREQVDWQRFCREVRGC